MAPQIPAGTPVSHLTQPPNQQPQNPQLQAAAAAAHAANANPNAYPGYNLASIDMTSFNGIDWSSMYGMYV